jgi:hypothetical protein
MLLVYILRGSKVVAPFRSAFFFFHRFLAMNFISSEYFMQLMT